ncbi:EamA family transporter [Haloarculaceae archaeon H-GB2-1]|nr:EamA family transporter [Haloarculaceae archaeon H-GB1-1]MEA5386118.1 EamA family transporter [Haloarculaceae archaeon H-GB11]MEA5407625.1 EamA family transporter [Haloarculaceae archaeon H-GB2-1]
MSYLLWAILALAAYTLVAPLVNVAMSEMPSEVVVFISNTILVVGAAGVLLTSNHDVGSWLTHQKAPYAYAAGLALAVGILAYYRALSLGPVSVVVPIFGMFLVTSSLLGIVVLDEPLTARKGLGLAFAVAAVYLTAVE